jgi:Chalcone isomerase-like
MQLRSATKRPLPLPLSVLRSVLLAALFLTVAVSAWGLDRGADGWFHTGDGVRVKKVAFVNFDVYSIGHDMKDLPPEKTKQAVINMDTDKRFNWRQLRDVDKDKIQNAIKEAFAMNGYTDQSKIGPYVGAFSNDLQKGQAITIKYDSAAKAVTVTVQGGGTATVPGVDFMKAVWSIWFGKIDQPSLGDALIKNM